MGYEKTKTAHAGAKNGGGAWMTRAKAKLISKHQRRVADKQATTESGMDVLKPNTNRAS
jgi:hypothetical protein